MTAPPAASPNDNENTKREIKYRSNDNNQRVFMKKAGDVLDINKAPPISSVIALIALIAAFIVMHNFRSLI